MIFKIIKLLEINICVIILTIVLLPIGLSSAQVLADESHKAFEELPPNLLEAKDTGFTTEKNLSYFIQAKSYSTARDTEPPRYVKQASKTWLNDYGDFKNLNWLDVGLDYRLRYEYRDNDFRRTQGVVDEPILLRTRAYVAIKEILDPLRFTLEIEDSRRNHSQFSRSFDTRDINLSEPIQAYLEFHFKENFLGKDSHGNDRPISIKAGRQAFDFLDRRLISRNEWRNTTNAFQGIRATAGQQANDWQLDFLALKPMQRFGDRLDEVDHAQDLYGVIGAWRAWSGVVTIEPYYLKLRQNGSKVKFGVNGDPASASAKINRDINTLGIRAYGVSSSTGWDYDLTYSRQWGDQDSPINIGTKLDHKAYAYTTEVGYSFKNKYKPRVSAFYGVVTGDQNIADNSDQRFDRLFGFGRPWSSSDYIQMENIEALKLRVEAEPILSWIEHLKVDAGYSWYQLENARDRWSAANNLIDKTGKSGNDLGQEFDARIRFPISPYVGANLGYSHFWGGDFVKNNYPSRQKESDFLYLEVSVSAF